MKKLMGGLKGFNAKEFFLNHAEKVGFGVFLLVALLVLAQTDWSRTDKSPQKIKRDVDSAQLAIQNSVWPADQKASFALQDFAGDAQRVRGPLAIAPYEYSTNMWWPLYRKQELAKDPELLAVLDLRASAGTVALPISTAPPADLLAANQEPGVVGPAGAPQPPAAPPNLQDQFAPRKPIGAGMGGPGDPAMGLMPPEMAPNAGMPADMMMGGEMMAGGMMGLNSNVEARGERFISVRGVWPIWQQLEKMQRALNLQTTNDARNYLQLVDFVLERQTAVPGTDPWAGPWDVVDISRALEILDEAVNYDIDRVDPQILDPVITMPMPERKVGYWGDYATHPRIEQFKLPPAELEREMKFQDKLMEEYKKYQLEEERRATPSRGFSKRSLNTRGMAEAMFGSEYAPAFDTSMRMEMERDPTMRMGLPDLKTRLTAVGRLLLFRYLDFDVRPGYAYRYRVKLIMRNPNFERPLDQVLTESVAQGLERETPWSEPSNPEVVPESVNYFVQEIDRDPVNESRPVFSRPLARIDFFEWDPSVGTMIHDFVDVKSYGQFLSETKKSLKLDVVKETFKDSDVTFQSDDLLVDTTPDAKIDPSLHPDLQLPQNQRGRVDVLPQAMFVDETGDLVTMNRQTNKQKQTALSTYVTMERAPWEAIKNKEAQPANPLLEGEIPGMMEASPYGGMMPEEMKPDRKGKRNRKPQGRGMMEGGP